MAKRIASTQASNLISVVALVVSILTYASQNIAIHSVNYRISNISIILPEGKQGEPNSSALRLTLSVFNVGNRSVALTEVELYTVSNTKFVNSDDLLCSSKSFSSIPLIGVSSEVKFSATPEVIAERAIFSKEFAFDMLFYQRDQDDVTVNGTLCLKLVAVNSAGTPISKQIMLFKRLAMELFRTERSKQVKINNHILPFGRQIRIDDRVITGALF